ncbi:MAG: amidase [Chloroflexota bacterium]|nr:amidase [Chloroflexota bacterium]
MADGAAADGLTERSAGELAALIRRREVSPVEIVEAFLARIEAVNPSLGAYVTVTAELALARAAAAERGVMTSAPDDLGPLHGVPVSIKELSDTAGVPTTYASRAYAGHVPDADKEAVARLFRAGAVMLGKTNSPEFGLNATTEGGLFPPTRNPWDPGRSAGGSSGGAGAALAARLCPLAEGSDGGGSIRIPAAACGVAGLKPSRGRISSAPSAGEGWAGFSTSGPMARTVADLALALDAMAGPAVGDPYPTPNPRRPFAASLSEALPRLRIGWTTRNPLTEVEPEVAAAVERVAGELAAMGHELVEGAPETRGMWAPFVTIVAAHTAAIAVPDLDLLGPHPRVLHDIGRELSALEYLAAKQETYLLSRQALAWFEEFDLLLCPTLPRVAPPLGELDLVGMDLWDALEPFTAFCFWVNMTGQPAISLPLAWSDAGLPIGVQLVGRQLADSTLLALAARLEEVFPWHDREPSLGRA